MASSIFEKEGAPSRKNGDGDSLSIKIPLREWAALALSSACGSSLAIPSASDFADSKTSCPSDEKRGALSSDDFLLPALQVAFSLADQICSSFDFDDTSKSAKKGCANKKRSCPGDDWADHIVVHLMPSTNEGSPCIADEKSTLPRRECQQAKQQQAQLPGSSKDQGNDDKDIQAACDIIMAAETVCVGEAKSEEHLLDSFSDFGSFVFAEECDENFEVFDDDLGNGNEGTISDRVEYLRVAKAEILSTKREDNGKKKKKSNLFDGSPSQDWCIYSLGLVLYELFSGGLMPPDLSELDPDNDLCTVIGFDPIDLSGALSLDDLFDGGPDLLDSNAVEHKPIQRENKNKKRAQIEKRGELQGASSEALRMEGVPGPLCEMISNMIDCAKGDFRGRESYSKIEDVRSDLQLMMSKPNLFLRGLDVSKMAITGLQLDQFSFCCRDAELQSLQKAYQNSICHQSEIALISGPSGSGKTVLARQLEPFVCTNGGVFLSGKYDLMKQATPFSAISEAFGGYCNAIAGSETSREIGMILKSSLGSGIYLLMKIIPSLKNIVGFDSAEDFGRLEQDCADAQKRLQYLFSCFVDIISSKVPITLFLDDLQWADRASIELIKRMVLAPSSPNKQKQIFFLGCCRDDKKSKDTHWKSLLDVQHFDVKVSMIDLTYFDKGTLNTAISEMLCLSPRITRPLSEIIYSKTRGNPLFFSQLMTSLNREGLLHLSLTRRRWLWNEEQILLRRLPDDVAAFFSDSIGNLQKKDQSALSLLSCFGQSTTFAVLELLEKSLELQLISSLDVAVEAGLLCKRDGQFSFVHDQIQEKAFYLMNTEERRSIHFKLGLALSSCWTKNGNDGMLFTAVGQLNLGGTSAVSSVEQSSTIANLNLVTGQKAIEMSDFATALNFFVHGISFLPENHWDSQYKLSLQLFELAVRCAFSVGNFDKLRVFSDEIFSKAKTFEDKVNTFYINTCALANTCPLPLSVEKGIKILSQLSEDLPQECSDFDLKFHLDKTKSMLRIVPESELLNYKKMEEPMKMMAMKFLARLQLSLFMVKPSLLPLVSLKMVQLSLVHGMCPTSPSGFVYYGALLARLGDIPESYRIVSIAKKLLDKLETKEVAGEVYAVSTHIVCFVEPLQSCASYFLRGFDLAMASGDIHQALMNNYFHSFCLFWTGTQLEVAKEKFAAARSLMKQHNHQNWLTQTIPLEKTIRQLMGNLDVAKSPLETENSVDISQVNAYEALVLNFQCMYDCFLFREFDEMIKYGNLFFQCKENQKQKVLAIGIAFRSFFGGLVAFWAHRQLGNPTWFERGEHCLHEMRSWEASAQWNFENKRLLLEAECHFCLGNFTSAEECYKNAILSSQEHKFDNETAISCELAGHFFLMIGQQEKSAQYLAWAHKKYCEWGALAKANEIDTFARNALNPTLANWSSVLVANSPSSDFFENQCNDLVRPNSKKRLESS